MKPIWMYLDEAIDKGVVKNDSETAAKLNVTRASVSGWRSGKAAPNDEQAIALARLLQKPEIELLAEAAAHRAKTPEARSYWEQIAKYSATYASTAAMTLVSTLAFMAVPFGITYSPETRASTDSHKIIYQHVSADNKHYQHHRVQPQHCKIDAYFIKSHSPFVFLAHPTVVPVQVIIPDGATQTHVLQTNRYSMINWHCRPDHHRT